MDIRLKSGRRIRQSAGTKDKQEAQRLHDKLKYELWQQEQMGEKPKRLWDEAAVRWIEEMSAEKKSIGSDISRLRGLGTFRGLMLKHMTRETIMATISVLPCSNSTKNRYLALVRAILNKATNEWMLLERAPKLPLYREAKRRIRWLMVEEAERLVAALPEEFSLNTGLRQRNVLDLKWSQIDLDRKVAWVHPDKAKAGRSIGIALNQTTVNILEKQIGRHPQFVFTNSRGGRVTSISSRIWKNALEQSGIKNFRWHDLRHTWASWLVQKGVPLAALQEMGGWESISMVQRYAHLSPEHLHGHAALLDAVLDTNWSQAESAQAKSLKTKSLNDCLGFGNLVGPVGFEPTTKGL
ncbi:MAG: site-specific integrase [Neisseria sp.]|uniref:tyrosine-type recombinase/integrase n=1 Tax=Neisseria sp. TaxID=192066 RepID=UPI0026DC4150|nr:site-specific integrase [Neisseria sp.]MDO4641047.1 site-specific integrase [Neisseria sp.]